MSMKRGFLRANQERESLTRLRNEVYEREEATLKKSLIDDVQVTKAYQPIIFPIIARFDKLLGIPQRRVVEVKNEEEVGEEGETVDEEEDAVYGKTDVEETVNEMSEEETVEEEEKTVDEQEEADEEKTVDEEEEADEANKEKTDEEEIVDEETTIDASPSKNSISSYASIVSQGVGDEETTINASPLKDSISSYTSIVSCHLEDYDVELEAETRPEKKTREKESVKRRSRYSRQV